MSAPVINIDEYRKPKRSGSGFRAGSKRGIRDREQAAFEITPEDIKSFMCYRAIWKTILSDPVGWTAKLFIIALLFATIFGVLGVLF